jgi:hypothetical protein
MNRCFNYFLLVCLTILLGCRKDSDTIAYEKDVESEVSGFIFDGNEVVGNADINVNGLSSTTDQYGFFKLKNVRHNGKISVKANKKGFFPGSRTIYVTDEKPKNVKISLIEKKQKYIIDAAVGGAITDNGSFKLNFLPDGIVDEKNQNYIGQANVFVKYLDPDANTTFDEMPGSLIGQNLKGETNFLASFGMLGVIIEDLNGNPLQLKQGKECEMSIKIPTSASSNAPSIMPLWFYDENKDIWIEEGSAKIQGDYYVGSVKHFTYWNYDYPYDKATIKGTVLINGNPTSAKLAVKFKNSSHQRFCNTNKDGTFSGIVPANEVIELQVLSYCDDILLTMNPPIAIKDKILDIGIIYVNDPSNLKFIKYEGDITDCNNNPLQDGIVIVKANNNEFTTKIDANGHFAIELFTCNDNYITVTAKSKKDLKESNPIFLPPGINFNNLLINACGQNLDEYISMDISNGERQVFLGGYYLGQPKKYISSENSDGLFQLFSKFGTTGFPDQTKSWQIQSISINYLNYKNVLRNNLSSDQSMNVVTFTNPYKSTDPYLEGTYMAKNLDKYEIVSPTINILKESNLSITGSFRIKVK